MVSVIVPIYNVEQYLRQCLDSILGQTYKDIEIILIDDGSKDRSGLMCDEYAGQDSRITVIHQNNAGAAKARNTGTLSAKGEFFTYIDADDIVHPDYIKTLLNGMTTSNADISVCNHTLFKDDPKECVRVNNSEFSLSSGKEACNEIVNLHKTNMIVIWGKLYKSSFRQLLLMPENKSFEDEFTCYKVMYNATLVAQSDNALYYYRQREESLSHQAFSKKNYDKLDALQGAANWLKEQGDYELQIHAQKRYLLTIEIVWSKAFFGKAGKDVLNELKENHRNYYSQYKNEIWNCCTLLEKITLQIFRISPIIYSLVSRIYLIVKPES